MRWMPAPAVLFLALSTFWSTAHAELDPLSDAAVAELSALPADPEPESLTRNSHYWVSNENALELFAPHLEGRGGVLLGVGTDQNFIFAAWARAEVLILMDFDQAIVDLHRVYAVAFAGAADVSAFLAFWQPENVDSSRSAIEVTYGEGRQRRAALRAYKTARHAVSNRLLKVKLHLASVGRSSLFDDPAQYLHVKALFASRRVFAVRGDLTAGATVTAIGRALKSLGLHVGAYYPSNAEQYFDFTPQYRANILALPMNDRSVVIRTLGWGKIYGRADATYHYNVQPGLNFQRFLEARRIKSAGHMLKWRTPSPTVGFSTFEKSPEERPTPGPKRGPRKSKKSQPD